MIILYYFIAAVISYIPGIYIQKRISNSENKRVIKTIGNYLFLFLLQLFIVFIMAYLSAQTSIQAEQASGWIVVIFLFMSPIFLMINFIILFLANKRYKKYIVD